MAVNVKKEGVKLEHYWSKCVSAGRAKEGLRAAWQEQLRMAVKDCGFRYIRFHGLLHDDMCVYRVINGNEIYNFQYVDDLFDTLLDMGLRPVVELGFMLYDMADDNSDYRQFWWRGNVNPPADYDKWYELIFRLTKHFEERYGVDEIKEWYFEVWNEPNLHNGFWTGGKSKYLKLYEYAVKAIKSVNGDYRVGGPATSNYVPDDRFEGEFDDVTKHMTYKLESLEDAEWNPVWIGDFFRFCEEKGLPVDFVSVHPYPTDFALDGHGETSGRTRYSYSTTDDLRKIRKLVDESSFRGAEIILTEWSSSPTSRDNSHDYSPAAAYIVKANIESRGLVDALSYWAFTDIFEELGAGNKPFHGGFGMINYQGIKKPSYHAYRFLNALGDTELACGDNYIVTRDSKTGGVVICAFNYESNTIKTAVPITNSPEAAEAVMAAGNRSSAKIDLEGLRPGAAFVVERVNAENGTAMGMYKQLGYPEHLVKSAAHLCGR